MRASSRSAASAAMSWRRSCSWVRVRRSRHRGRVLIADWDRRPGQAGAAEHGPAYEHRVPREEAEAEVRAAGFTDVRAHAGYRDAYLLSARRE